MPRRIAYLASALALFGGLAVFILWRGDRVESSLPFKGIAPDSLSRIEIEKQGSAPLVLSKDAGIWHLSSPLSDLADGGQCGELVQALTGLSIGSEVSDDPSHYDLYDLSEASAIHLKVFTRDRAAAVLDAFFGKAALGFGTLYLRYAREKPVYLEQGLDPGLLRRQADAYRERAFFPNELAPIRTLTLSAGPKMLALKEADPEWVTALNLRVAAFLSEKMADTETGLDAPVLAVEAAGAVRHARWLIGGPKAERKGKPAFRYARCDDRPGVTALVAVYDADALLKKLGVKP